jgi:hypothetical protein
MNELQQYYASQAEPLNDRRWPRASINDRYGAHCATTAGGPRPALHQIRLSSIVYSLDELYRIEVVCR